MKVNVHNDIVHLRVRVRLVLIPNPPVGPCSPRARTLPLAVISLVSRGPLHLGQAQFSYWPVLTCLFLLSVKRRMGAEAVNVKKLTNLAYRRLRSLSDRRPCIAACGTYIG